MDKKCFKCKKVKDVCEFHKNRSRKDGVSHRCKDCSKGYDSKRYPTQKLRRMPYIIHKKSFCETCGFEAKHSCQLDVDHVDGNHSNNEVSNLKTLCANCHRLKTQTNKDFSRKK